MKLSAIFVSVNLAATLPVASAGAVFAADAAKSDKANWLKSSLASLDTAANHKKGERSAKLSYSVPTADITGSTLHSNGVKLRPFVANRKLPSQHDLDVQFIAQTAKMAAVAAPQSSQLVAQTPSLAVEPEPLSGRVSEVYSSFPASPVSNYGSVGYVKQSSSRLMPGQVPSVPGQIRQFRASGRTRYLPKSQPVVSAPEEAMESQHAPSAPRMIQAAQLQQVQKLQQTQQLLQMQQMQQAVQQMQQAMQQGPAEPEAEEEPGGISSEEQSIIDRMVAAAHARTVDGAASSEGAGPPPFPLSLLPQDQLKSMIGGLRHTHTDAAPSYFGSWRGNSISALPASGFHSYVPHAASGSRTRSGARATVKAAGPTTKQATTANMHQASEGSRPMAQLRRLTPQDSRVAQYPPYLRFGGAIAY